MCLQYESGFVGNNEIVLNQGEPTLSIYEERTGTAGLSLHDRNTRDVFGSPRDVINTLTFSRDQ